MTLKNIILGENSDRPKKIHTHSLNFCDIQAALVLSGRN